MGSKIYGDVQANGNSSLHLGDSIYYGDQERTKYIPDALFNAYGQDHRPCHPKTRRELLEEIEVWAERSTDKSIFWLNGMAGTGKSTIAYTVAERLDQQRSPDRARLGASFFFKRGEGDRASAALFFPTIVRQLRQRIPNLAVHIDQAVNLDPDIYNKALGEQFDKLLEGPLSRLGNLPVPTTYIIVVDALDECQKEEDMQTLIQLWSRVSQYSHRYIRWFLTSRPELAIQFEFSRMSINTRWDIVLHEIPPPTIKRDISIFLADTLSEVRNKYNHMPLVGVPLPEDWPGVTVVNELTQMAVPLFIIAATICRFVQNKDFDPRDQLDIILQSGRTGQLSDLGQTYLPILERVVSSLANETTRNRIYQEFRLIVGGIVTVAEPLSCNDLAALLDLSQSTIALRLRPLCSVLQIPQEVEEPVRLFHLSFREFLSSDEIRDQPFWIDRIATHAVILTRCLVLMSQPYPMGLRENICRLPYPGQPRGDLAYSTISSSLSGAMQYACRYWIYHAQQSALEICDEGAVHHFLQEHFLHWLEALSLLGCLSNALGHIVTLQSLLATTGSTVVSAFLQDAQRFILANRYICARAPLQLYSSAVIFTPQASTVRQICGKVPAWIQQGPITLQAWGAELQKLEGHAYGVNAVAFSPDGSQLASASEDTTVRLWDAKTGQEVQMLHWHADAVNGVVFSPDGTQLASASDDRTIRLWDARTGQKVRRLKGHTASVWAVAFSPDGSQLASASRDRTVRLWDAKTGQEVRRLKGHTASVWTVAFSPDGSQLASASRDRTIRLWDAKTGQEVQMLEGHTDGVTAVAFSPDGSQLASVSDDGTVRLWDAKMGQEVQVLEGHTDGVNAVAFSPDGSQLASASEDRTVRLWDAKTGREAQLLEGHVGRVTAVAFSPNGSQLASASEDRTVRLWDARTGQKVQRLNGHADAVNAVAFSPDGSQLASASRDRTVRLWDAKTGQEVRRLKGHTASVWAVAFSPDGSQLASASRDGTIRLWDAKTGRKARKLKGHIDGVRAVAFSPDGSQLASKSDDGTVRMWNTKTGQQAHILDDSRCMYKICFSDDGETLFVSRGTTDIGETPCLFENGACEIGSNLKLDEDWIECGNRKVLWLPHEYRSTVSAVYDNMIAIGCRSGLVSFLQIMQP